MAARDDGGRRAQLALVIVRVVAGGYFAKALWTKLQLVPLAGAIPVPMVSVRWQDVMPKIVARQAEGNPIGWYKRFLEGVVLPNSDLFAGLTAWGEIAVGVGLVLGLFTRASALLGLSLVLVYGLATWWMSPAQQGLHLVLGAVMVALFLGDAGKVLGLDALRGGRKARGGWGR